MDQAVLASLRDAHDNLKARRLLPHAAAVDRGMRALQASNDALQAAWAALGELPALRGEVESLKRQVAHLKGEVAKAQEETKRASVPRLEALAEARAEARNLIRPFLQGDPGARMLALTIWRSLDEAWGKELK